jgi:hypothetical protein
LRVLPGILIGVLVLRVADTAAAGWWVEAAIHGGFGAASCPLSVVPRRNMPAGS